MLTLAQAAVFKLIVTAALANGTAVDAGPFVYNKATWPTQAACEEFVNSDAGKTSIDALKTAIENGLGVSGVVLKPVCTDKAPE